MSDEFTRIAEISRRLHPGSADVQIGIGDDAAVLAPTEARQVVSVDTAVEGVHFRRELASWIQIGYRSLVAALSDLAAMGARPRAALAALIVPVGFRDEWLFELADGLAEAALEYGSPVVGGNLSAGTELSITCTVLGLAEETVLTRSGARANDRIYVTGSVGEAALGLRCVQQRVGQKEAEHFIERWRRPTAKILVGQRLLGVANAAIDISDGLLQDLGHLCQASGVGAQLRVADLPLGEGAVDLARQTGADAIGLALGGGEDYELIFTAPEGAAVRDLGICIGTILPEPGPIALIGPQGQPLIPKFTGYTHRI